MMTGRLCSLFVPQLNIIVKGVLLMETQVLPFKENKTSIGYTVAANCSGTSRDSINQIKSNFFNKCPLLSLRAATMSALVNTCEARRRINNRAIRSKLNAVKVQHNVDFLPTSQSYIYPACADCDMYFLLRDGKLPTSFKHIQIIKV